MKKEEIVICECHSTEHQMVFLYSDEDVKFPNSDVVKNIKTVYIHTHLNKHPFWTRVKYGIKYIFGYQCRYGAFDEFIINPEDAHKFESVVEYLKQSEKDA